MSRVNFMAYAPPDEERPALAFNGSGEDGSAGREPGGHLRPARCDPGRPDAPRHAIASKCPAASPVRRASVCVARVEGVSAADGSADRGVDPAAIGGGDVAGRGPSDKQVSRSPRLSEP